MKIVYEDPFLLVVDKPAGMPTHAAAGHDAEDLYTLLSASRPYVGLLHRLDREASGLVLLSTSPAANADLQQQLERHAVERVYHALLAGRLAAARTVDRPISDRAGGRHSIHRRPPPDAKAARSHFTPLDAQAQRTLVEVRLETGRKHQIRIHAAAIGHPLLGDRRYGGPPYPRLALHATRLAFTHPHHHTPLSFESPASFA